MRYLAVLLPAAALAVNFAEDAGGPQSAPTYTDTSAAPTVATIVTYSGTSSVAPLPYATHTLPHPIINGTYATGGSTPTSMPGEVHPSYPTSLPGGVHQSSYSTAGNLSTTAGGHPTTSVVVATVTGANGSPSTQTSVVVVTPSGGGATAPSASGTGSTQSGEGASLQGGAAAALAVFGGFLAFML